MTKAEKQKAFKVFVNVTLSAFCIIEAFESAQALKPTLPEPTPMQRQKRILKACQAELAKEDCSINKVEDLFKQFIEHES